jgi:hypothetical protein
VVGDAVFRRMLAALSPKEIGALQDYLRRCIDAIELEDVKRDEEAEVGGAPSTAVPRAPRRAARRAAAR